MATLDRVAATDDELVESVRCGDDRAFEELYRRHRPAVVAFVRRRLRDVGAAEDVTQEAFTSALRRMRQTDAEIIFRAWIYEIARNASIDHHRRRSRVREVSIDAGPALAAADSARLVGTSMPDATALGRERFEHLRGALDELSETHNRVIVLRELEGLSYHEIGQRMELSPSAVESTLFRARRRLEHEYAELDSGRRCRIVDAAIGRLAAGGDSDRDRGRLARHARRCAGCRRRARSCGVEPLEGRGARAAAALLPLPVFLRDRLPSVSSGSASAPGSQLGPLLPSLELPATLAGKAVALLATAMLVAGGGATLGGVGPLAPGGPEVRSDQRDRGQDPVSRDAGPATRPSPRGAAERTAGDRFAAGGRETGAVREAAAFPEGAGGGISDVPARGNETPSSGQPGALGPEAPALPGAPAAGAPATPGPSAPVMPRFPEVNELGSAPLLEAPVSAPEPPSAPPASAPEQRAPASGVVVPVPSAPPASPPPALSG